MCWDTEVRESQHSPLSEVSSCLEFLNKLRGTFAMLKLGKLGNADGEDLELPLGATAATMGA